MWSQKLTQLSILTNGDGEKLELGRTFGRFGADDYVQPLLVPRLFQIIIALIININKCNY